MKVKKYKAKSSKGKNEWGKIWRNPGRNCQVSSPVQSHRTPTVNCDNIHKMLPTSETHYSISVQGFYWMLIMQAPPAWHVLKFQTLRRKDSVQHKPYYLCKKFQHSVVLFLTVNRGNHPKSGFHMPAKCQMCKQTFQRTVVRPVLFNAFLHNTIGHSFSSCDVV